MEKKAFKTMFIVVVLLLATNLMFAQNSSGSYTPFRANSIWSVSDTKYMSYGDTIINQKEYMKIYKQTHNAPFEFDLDQSSYYAAIRNDLIEKKVYVIFNDQEILVKSGGEKVPCNPFDEFLLYDFSLQLGDSAILVDNYYQALTLTKVKRVDQIQTIDHNSINNSDSLLVLSNSDTVKRILLQAIGSGSSFAHDSYYIMEGIGSSSGLFSQTPCSYFIDGGCLELICFSDINSVLYSSPNDLNNDCYEPVNGVNVEDYETDLKLTLYPNPSDGFIHLDLDENCTDCYVEVFNLLGVSVYSTTISESMTIDLSNNPAGIYFLSLRNKESVLGVKKVIIN